jgi:hypothetical protein
VSVVAPSEVRSRRRVRIRGGRWLGSLALCALVIGAAILWVSLTHVRPSFDAFGWLVWGRETWRGHLNTSAAPSWKGLPYLFTLPYALFGRIQMWLWSVTATAAALAGWILASRIAFRLARSNPEVPPYRDLPALFAALAGFCVVPLMYGMWHQMLIADSDPMVVTLCLAAIDAGLRGRRQLAMAMLVLATLGRPEATPFAVLYALWMVRVQPRRWLTVLGWLCLIPLGLFLVPALSSKSPFIAGDLAEGFRTAIKHGSRIGIVFYRFASLYPPAVWIAGGVGMLWALARRRLTWLVLLGSALLWVLIEIAFAYHGWPAAPRYVMEPAAVVGAVGAAAGGRAVRFAVSGSRIAVVSLTHGLGRWSMDSGAAALLVRGVRFALLAAVVALCVTLIPASRARAKALRHDIDHEKLVAARIDHLPLAIAAAGGESHVKACAPPLSFVGNQSLIAWDLTLNVGDVNYKWHQFLRRDLPAVFFKPEGSRWVLHAINIPFARRSACRGIQIVPNRSQLRALRRRTAAIGRRRHPHPRRAARTRPRHHRPRPRHHRPRQRRPRQRRPHQRRPHQHRPHHHRARRSR